LGVRFGEDPPSDRVALAVQREGTCGCGPSEWRDRRAMRIGVSSRATRAEDAERSLEAILRVARRAAPAGA
jgi:hypothetical protein